MSNPGTPQSAPVLSPPPSADPLSPEHYREIEAARARQKKINRAIHLATFDGWCAVVLGVLSAPFIFFSTTALVVCLVLAAVAATEFRGRAMLRRLDERGATVLGLNQLGLFTAILIYSLWRIWTEWQNPTSLGALASQDPALAQFSSDDFESLVDLVVVVVYSAVILASAVFQGGLALYFMSRWRHIREHRELTPEWVRRTLDAG